MHSATAITETKIIISKSLRDFEVVISISEIKLPIAALVKHIASDLKLVGLINATEVARPLAR